MSENNSNGGSVGVGFTGLLTLVFITLKLVGVIDWSWLWVLSPIWIPIGIALIVVGIMFIWSMFPRKRKK